MAKQVTDEEASLKRQARRRLIGAVALVTAVAVTLPMVLDSEPKPAGVDIELRIPDKDKIDAFHPQAVAPAAVSAVAPTVAASAPAVAELKTSPVVAPLSPAAPEPVVQADKQAAAPPIAKSEIKQEAKAESADAKLGSGKPSFVLQVGAYANAEIAKDWQGKLKKQGFHAYTEPAGARTRLRVGPFSSHEAAEAARQKLQALSLRPDLIDMGNK